MAEEEEAMSALSRKELRKLKLAEYLAAKGRLKVPNPRPYLRQNCPAKQPAASAPRVVDAKENQAPQKTVGGVGLKGAAAAASRPNAVAKVLSVSNKVNIEGGVAAAQKQTSTSSLARLRGNQNLSRTDATAASKSSLRQATGAKTRPDAGAQPSGRAPPNAPRTLAVKPSSRIHGGSKPAPPAPAGSRVSLGPLVRTRTGLTPAVPRPHVTKPSAAHAATAIPAKKAPLRRTLPGYLSRSAAAGRAEVKGRRETPPNCEPQPGKCPPPPSSNRPTRGFGPTSAQSRLGASRPASSQTTSNPPAWSRSGASRPASGQTTSNPPARNRSGVSRPASGQTTSNPPARNRSGASRPASGQTTSNPPARSHSGASRPASGLMTSDPPACSHSRASRPASGLMTSDPPACSHSRASRPASDLMTSDPPACSHSRASRPASGQTTSNPPACSRSAAAAELQRKADSSRTEPSGSAGVRPAAPQTAPQPFRTIRLTGQTTKKVPVRPAPQTEGQKVTAAQQERMRKLQEWRQARGISYKRPSMTAPSTARRRRPAAPAAQPFWESMKKEDDAHSLICAVDRSLADCIQLLEEGCPPDQVGGVLSRLPPVSQKFTRYWICRARLMERDGDLDVLPLFEEAVRVVAEPVDELRTVVFEILKRKEESQAPPEEKQAEAGPTGPDPSRTPNPVRALIWGQSGDSSVVKYRITATPGGPPSQQRAAARVEGQEVRFFTPVRRSVRIERSWRKYPAALQDHDPCVASYDDLFSEEEEPAAAVGGVTEPGEESGDGMMYVYRENQALGDKVLVKLVYDDSP